MTIELLNQDIEFKIATTIINEFFIAPIVIDIGAEKGSFINLALNANANKVIAFEPLEKNLIELKRIYGNRANVEIHPFGISDKNGKQKFYIARNCDGEILTYHHSITKQLSTKNVKRGEEYIYIETYTLENLLDIGLISACVDFLKIDTDGHDLCVLNGLGKLRPKFIMLEYWNSLDEYSGETPYKDIDLINWASQNLYRILFVAKRNGALNFIEFNVFSSEKKDWGNLFLVRNDISIPHSLIEKISNLSIKLNSDIKKQVNCSDFELIKKEKVIKELILNEEIINQTTKEYQRIINEYQIINEKLNQELILNQRIINEYQIINEKLNQEFILKENVIQNLINKNNFNIVKILIRIIKALLPKYKIGKLYHHEPLKIEFHVKNKISFEKNKRLPKISIVIPSFNQGKFISNSIESVLSQTYANLNLHVQDGGSIDSTVSILKQYIFDKRFSYSSELDNGQADAINIGFKKCDGDILAWLNSDDLITPNALNKVAKFFIDNDNVDVVYGDRIIINEDGYMVGRWVLPNHDSNVLKWADFIPQETMFFRRRIWDKVGKKVDTSFNFALDWDLIMRFNSMGANFHHIPSFLGIFRLHKQQKTQALINKSGLIEMDRIREKYLGRTPSYLEIKNNIKIYLIKHIISDILMRNGLKGKFYV